MAEDFYLNAARERANQLSAEIAAAKADLQAARSNADPYSAAASISQLADLQAQQRNLGQLYNEYVKSQTPTQQYVSPESRAARSPQEMDAHDMADVMNQSRYRGLGTGR